jgi:hypothetical protein
MTEYTLVVRIPNAGKEISYSIHLSELHASYPEDYFRIEVNRSRLCYAIQNESVRSVSPDCLNSMISKWISEIREGLRRTTFVWELPPDMAINAPQEQRLPQSSPIITPPRLNTETQPKPKQPIPIQKRHDSIVDATPAAPSSRDCTPSSLAHLILHPFLALLLPQQQLVLLPSQKLHLKLLPLLRHPLPQTHLRNH